MWDDAWEKVFSSRPWGKYPAEDLIRFVARNYFKATDRAAVSILEIGCGPGANLWFLSREGFSFAGVDGSTTAVRLAQERLDAETPGWRDRGRVEVGDIVKLPFADASFDAVLDSEAVYANPLEASRAIYAEAARVAKPGGLLFSRAFSAGSWGDGTGEKVGHHAWLCAEGPLVGDGLSRFTTREEIDDVVRGWRVENVDQLTRTEGGGAHAVLEWLITARKA